MFLKNHFNAANIIIALAGHFKVRVTPKTIITELELHPNNPSLLAISDVLSQFGVINEAFNNITTDQLKIIPCPFVAVNKNEFVLVKSVDENNINVNEKYNIYSRFSGTFYGCGIGC